MYGPKEAELLLGPAALARRAKVLDERERVDRLLDVDRDRQHLEVAAVLLVLALPDDLRVDGRIAGVAQDGGPLLLVADERLGSAVGMFGRVAPSCPSERTGVAGPRAAPDRILSVIAHRPLIGCSSDRGTDVLQQQDEVQRVARSPFE